MDNEKMDFNIDLEHQRIAAIKRILRIKARDFEDRKTKELEKLAEQVPCLMKVDGTLATEYEEKRQIILELYSDILS